MLLIARPWLFRNQGSTGRTARRRNRRRFRSKNRLILRKIRASRYASLIRLNQMKSEGLGTNLSGEGYDAMARNQTTAARLIPARPSLASLRKAAATSKACDLWKRGRQTVFGEGKPDAKVMFVGEQPGDREDIVGRPFVGAAGKLLDQALEKAGIDRTDV